MVCKDVPCSDDEGIDFTILSSCIVLLILLFFVVYDNFSLFSTVYQFGVYGVLVLTTGFCLVVTASSSTA